MQTCFHLRSSDYGYVLVDHFVVSDDYVRTALLFELCKRNAVGLAGDVDALVVAVDALLMELLYLTAALFVYLTDNVSGRLCRVETLNEVSAEVYDGLELLRRLDALRKSLDAVVMAEIYDLADEVLLLGVFVDIAEEGAVYLDEIRHITQEIAHIGVARSVVVNSDVDVHFFKVVLQLCKLGVLQLGFLSELNDHSFSVGGKVIVQLVG